MISFADLLSRSQRESLRALRKRLANRAGMRARRSDPLYYRRLCAGVDLPLEAGTCGRLVNRSAGTERCYRCYVRRQWLLNHAMTPYEAAIAGGLDADLEADREAEAEAEAAYDDSALVPLLDAVDDLLV